MTNQTQLCDEAAARAASLERSYDNHSDEFTFPSGTRLYANESIIGIDDHGFVYQGYDGDLRYEDLSPDEMRTLADMMIARWTKFRADIDKEQSC
jgi:hypothetical protein